MKELIKMENKQRLINGKAMLQRVDAEAADHVMASLDRVAPDVAKLILEFAFNDIYTRPGLSLQQRELVTITSLLTKVIQQTSYVFISTDASTLGLVVLKLWKLAFIVFLTLVFRRY
ncbi:K01607 4-carboxymuconolactone decarboxylase [Lactiplantibacillus plantarum]|nr:K01607 4-carboxymuconolactone decarboxylase [Lactiplantibacillus plantarum]